MGLIQNDSHPIRWPVGAGLLVLMLSLAGTAGGIELGPTVQSNGGGRMTGATHILDITIGEPITGNLASASHQAGVGFWYMVAAGGSSGVSEVPPVIAETRLFQNAPNPFNPSTTIRFAVSRAGPVRLRLYDLQGRQIATLVDEEMGVGEHTLIFQPQGLASGVYLYQLKTIDRTLTRRLLLLK